MNTKICTKCKVEKDIEEFWLHTPKKGAEKKRHCWCHICRKAVAKAAVKKYNKTHRGQNLNYEHYNRAIKREHIHEHYRKQCVKCKESRVYLLDFHHIDPKQKKFNPLTSYTLSLSSIIAEIEKCAVLCANCHREFHYFERRNKITLDQYLNGITGEKILTD